MPMPDHLAGLLLDRLLWTSLQAAALVGIIALVVRVVPRLPATARCALWWLVGLQLVIGLGWQAPVRLPWLAPSRSMVVMQTANQSRPPPRTRLVAPRNESGAAAFDWRSMPTWRDALAALWLLGIVVQLPSVVRVSRRMRRLLRGADRPEAFLRRQCEELSRRMDLRHCPRLLVTSAVGSPLVTGWRRPVILWPARAALTKQETSLALAHELAHVQRGDLWLACVPAIAQGLFFFNPLVRWAVCEYAAHREAACDARAMQALDTDPQGYGRLLLRLGIADLGPAALAGASSTFRGLQRRLLMLQSAGARVPRPVGWLLVVSIALVGLVPYRPVAASAPGANPGTTSAGPANRADTLSFHCKGPGADDIRFCGSDFLVYAQAAKKGQGAVLFDKGKVIITGDHADVVAANRFYQPGVNLLWFRRDAKTYVVRDRAILRRADAWTASVAEHFRNEQVLDSGLDELNQRVGVLNQQLGKLNRQTRALADRQRTLTAQAGARAEPKAQAETRARIAGIEASMRARQTQIDALQQSMSAQRAELQKRQRKHSGEFREIPGDLAKLADDALESGAAREVDR